jgi:hypothetical protein
MRVSGKIAAANREFHVQAQSRTTNIETFHDWQSKVSLLDRAKPAALQKSATLDADRQLTLACGHLPLDLHP